MTNMKSSIGVAALLRSARFILSKTALHRSAATLFTALLIALPSFAHAQVVIKKSAYATATSIPPFTGDPALATQATRILSSDLDRSDWFKIVGAGSGEINIVGAVNRSGAGFSLEMRPPPRTRPPPPEGWAGPG